MNDRANPEALAPQLLDVLQDHFAYIEWGTPSFVGYCYVFYDWEAGVEYVESPESNQLCVPVPLPRWKAGRCVESQQNGKPPKNKEKRFEDLGSALEWLNKPLAEVA